MSESTEVPAAAHDFPLGGGEVGALIRGHDWSSTPLGRPEGWPQSLKVAIRIMLSSRFAMWMLWGPERTFFCNDAYRPTLGDKQGWLGKRSDEVWAEIWPDIGPRIEHVLETGKATWDEALLLYLERSGFQEETYHTFSYSPLANDVGAIAGMLCVVAEETERVIGERRLRVLRDLGIRMADTRTSADVWAAVEACVAAEKKDLPFALAYLSDGDGTRLRLASASGVPQGHRSVPTELELASGDIWRACDVLRGAPDVLVEHLPPGPWETPSAQALIVPIAAQGQARPVGVFIAGLNPYRPLDVSYRGFIDLFVSQIAAALASVDAYQTARTRAEALAEIDRVKTAFFSNVSHEFRTPLTLMLGPIQDALADAAGLPPEQRNRLDVAHRNSRRLLRLVNELLDFSRIEAGRMQACFRATDLAALTGELASSFRSTIEKAGLCLHVDCPPLSQPVYVDRDMWEKIVLDLISNAFKFTFEGVIGIELRETDGAARLTVRDTGAGIPADELPRVFERFHRVEGAHGRSFEGSGIGLALVQELTRFHGGKIAVESEMGRGTVFRVEVPLGTAHLPAEHIQATPNGVSTSVRAQSFVEEAIRWLPGTAGIDALLSDGGAHDLPFSNAPSVPPGKPQRVLLADDNSDLRDYISRLLTERGYDVESVADGAAALAALQTLRPDILVADVMMPRVDGFGLLRAIRADRDLCDLPVIMLSARAGEESKIEGLAAGADDYLTKPFSARELLAHVGSNLAMARVRREAAEAIRATEARSGGVLAGMGEGYVLLDREFRVVEINDEGLRLEQRSREAIVGKTHWEAWPGSEQAEQGQLYKRAMAERVPVSLDVCYMWPAGHEAWVDMRAYPSGDGLAIFYRDISDRKQAEARQLLFLGLADRLRELSEPREIVAAAVELLGRHLSVSRVGYGEVAADGEAIVFETDYADGVAHLVGSFPVDAFGRGNIADLQRGLTTIYADLTIDPRTMDADFAAIETRSAMAVPLIRGNRFRAGLYLNHKDVREWSRDEVSLVEEVAARTWDALERARAEAQLRELNATLERRVEERTAELLVTEDALRQAQKMEAVGQLTGGLAHDFNNMLTGITGSLDLIGTRLEQGRYKELDRYIGAAQGAAKRAAALTHRLLAFSRRQTLDPKPTDVNRLIGGMEELIRRTVGPAVEIEVVGKAGLWPTLVDPHQLENALLNLCINARDAMPDGGRLTIETANKWLDERAGQERHLTPGQYLSLCVTDNGSGMTSEVIARAFEPFYTTKPLGEGTGLGLSMIYGFAQQSGGTVRIYSELGQGTTVCIYLPRHLGEAVQSEMAAELGIKPRAEQGETVLIVDDEPTVRMLVTDVLAELGYTAIEAKDGPGGLKILQSGARVDLLVTDVGLPGGMNGRQLADAGRVQRPDLKVLFITGYAENAVVGNGHLDHGMRVMTKPFAMDALAARIRDMIMGR